jgi:hypothetical protein
MSALLELECRVPTDGYDVITIDRARAKKRVRSWIPPRGQRMTAEDVNKVLLLPGATEDERYVAERWPEVFGPITRIFPDVMKFLRPRSERMSRFDLFEVGPSAFLEFAQTPTTEEGIKAFANRYGLMGPAEHFVSHWLDAWVLRIRAMERLVTLWEKSNRTGDFTKLIGLVERAPKELPLANLEKPQAGLQVLLKKDPRNATARLCIRPNNLYDALLAQLVLAIDGNLNLRACVVCRMWFTLEAGTGRSDKIYCSNACSMRAYRRRKGDTRKNNR